MKKSTDVGEFDRFVEHLPEDVAQSHHFVPVKEDKAADVPEEQDVKKEKFRLTLEEARERLQSGENVGPVLSDQLSVLILMDSEEAQAFLEDLPSTLEVSTRSGETHLYFLRGDGVESKDIPGVAELRTGDRYVVAPGSYASDSSGDSWGAYTVKEAREVVKITPDELPTELKPKKKLGERRNVNEYGWRIEKIREEDEALDGLLTREKPPNLGFMSKEDADREAIEKLLYWEFPPDAITKIMKEYRDCGEEITSLYTKVFSDFRERGENVVSDVKNVNTSRPGSEEEKLAAIEKKELGERAYDDNRAGWDCNTKFVTFRENVSLSSGKEIEERETFELPSELANELINKSVAVEHGWKCLKCGVIHERKKKPQICENPSCEKKGPFRSLHPTSHDEIGEVLLKNYHFATARDNGRLFLYDSGLYTPTGVERIIRQKVRMLNPSCKTELENEAIRYIRDETLVEREDLGLPPEKIAVQNGILNLETGDLEDNNPDRYALSRIPWPYKKGADCKKIKEKILGEIFRDEDIRTIQEAVGELLLKKYKSKKAVMLHGPGNNGKSFFMDLVEEFLGEENVDNSSMRDLAYDKFTLIDLYGKLANVHADISKKEIKITSAIKMLTGGGTDTIKGHIKHKQEKSSFENYAKLWFSTNRLPKIKDPTEAWWERWLLIDCPYRFVKNPDPSDPSEKKARPDLLDEIINDEEEMAGFLNWALDGLKRLRENDFEFTKSKSRAEIQAEWIMEADPLRAFVTEYVDDEARGAFVTKKDFHEAVQEYCEENGTEPPTMSTIGRDLPTIIRTTEFYPEVDGKQQKSWKGIRLKGRFSEHNRGESSEKNGHMTDMKDFHITKDTRERKSESTSSSINNNSKNHHIGNTNFELTAGDRVQVAERFVYGNELFGEGKELVIGEDIPRNVAGEAIEKGYIESVEEGEDTEFSNSPSQRDRVQALREIIREIAEDYEESIPVSAIVEEAKGEGIPSNFVEKFVERSLKKGELIPTEKDGEKAVRRNA